MGKFEKPLDPEPWTCWPYGDSRFEIRHAQEHEGYVEWGPRPEYEQDQDAYPDEVFG